jgi:hemolysin activation/secretion protein
MNETIFTVMPTSARLIFRSVTASNVPFFSLTVLSLACGLAAAQSPAAPDAGRLLREASPPAPAAPGRARPLLAQPATDAQSAPLPADNTPFTLSGIQIEGNTAIATPALQALLADVIGSQRSFSEIRSAVDRITEAYRAQGYLLARAIIPKQNMAGTNAVLRVNVLEGIVERVDAGAQTRLASRIAQANGVVVGQPVQQAALERATLLFAQRGFPDATAALSPGQALGSTAVTLRHSNIEQPGYSSISFQGSTSVQQGSPVLPEKPPAASRFSLNADNHGNRYSGTARLGADAALAHMALAGDELSARSTLTSGSQALTLAYASPLGYQGLRGSLSFSGLSYALGSTFAALQSEGQANTLAASLRYPLQLSADQQTDIEAGLSERRAKDDTLGSNLANKVNRSASLALIHSRSVDALSQRIALSLQAGRLDLSRNTTSANFDATTARAAGSFAKLRLDYAMAYELPAQQQLSARASHQSASKNLESSEKFSLGGASGVRGWASGEGSGDQGSLLSLQWRSAPAVWGATPSSALQSHWSVFLDWGQIQQHKTLWANALAAGQPNRYSLASAGISLNIAQPGSWQLSTTLAAPLGSNSAANASKNSDGRGKHARLWLSASKSL